MTNVLLHQVWDNFFESMIVTNQEGEIIQVNNAAKRLFSLNTSKYNNTSIFELFPYDLKDYFSLEDKSTGISLSFGTNDLLLTITPLQTHFLLVFKNMTKKQKIKYDLENMKEQMKVYDAILDKLDEGICVINEDKKILFYNKKIGEINSREPDFIKNKFIFEAFPNLEEENSKLLKTLRLEKPLNHRETHFTDSGKEMTILSETYPLSTGNRKIGAVEILKDITKQKQLEETIRLLNNDNDTSFQHKQSSNNTRYSFKDIIFTSREMGRIVEQAKKISRFSSNVLVVGETGTGKELFAQSIHNESPRKNETFIAQNCAAIPENLLEGLLFGTTTGSFTGAVNRAGIFEQAHKGTLLLDEINSISLDLQAKLLRVLQEKRVRRLGSDKEVDFDVRVISTMNEDPLEAIKNGRLREDLYYRISVVNLNIKPLRKRKIDITALVEHFIHKHSKALGIDVNGVEDNVMEFFLNFSWPGNSRQLEHTIEGALNLMYDEKRITFDHLSDSFQQQIIDDYNQNESTLAPTSIFESHLPLNERLELIETKFIKEALEEADGNITEASNILGISRQNLNYKLKKYNIVRKKPS
ncbi:sigma 54-interacting transcriptional regulator [Pseudogracilibacillus sp. SE30717A]|uniref:sigma 54-interacting transcriptional regulator n=1 Tax=Pseudogracilibacillus sp. SE30717A TaxID=3098293 RepID=UPI00300DF126